MSQKDGYRNTVTATDEIDAALQNLLVCQLTKNDRQNTIILDVEIMIDT